jgi:AraC-like DNA-binding protein
MPLPANDLSWSFSTRGMAPAAGLAALRALRDRGVLPIEPLRDCLAEADIAARSFGGVGLVIGTLSGLRQVIPPKAREFRDDVFLGVNIAGTVIVRHRAREVSLQPGDGILFSDVEAGFTSTRPRPSRFLGLRLPRRMLLPLVGDLDNATGRLIPGRGSTLRLLVDYLCFLGARQGSETAEIGRALSTHVADLLALSLGAHGDAAAEARGRGLRAVRLQAIKMDVARHLDDPELSIAAVAARHRMTSRYLHKLFETEEETFSEYVLARRLEFARRLLADRRLAGRSIAAIAFEVGFADLSHFNRAFRKRYNATPTDVRASEGI